MNIPSLLNTHAYKPREAKRASLRIGTDIMPIRERTKAEPKRDTISIEDSSLAFKQLLLQAQSASAADAPEINGFTVKVMGGEVVVFKGEEMVSRAGFKGDARVTVNEDGSLKVIDGKKALTNGVLRAQSEDEILIRTSGVDVDGGDVKSTVINLGGAGGAFKSGAGGTAYFGSYANATVEGGSAGDIFGGYFENSVINAGNGGNEFSGGFANSKVNGGEGGDVFSGTFISGSEIKGNKGDDTYSGRFADSFITDIEGNDSYGSIKLRDARKNNRGFDGWLADVNFWNTAIEDLDGDDSMDAVAKDSKIDLGTGDNYVSGAFVGTEVSLGGEDDTEGGNTIRAFYAEDSTFMTNAGEDNVMLATSMNSMASLGEGKNSVTAGLPKNSGGWTMKNEDNGDVSMQGSRWGRDVQRGSDYEVKAFGHQEGTMVDATQGETLVTIVIDGVAETLNSLDMVKPETEEEKAAKETRPFEEVEQEDERKQGAETLAGTSANRHLDGARELNGRTVNPYQRKDVDRLLGKDTKKPEAKEEDSFLPNAAKKPENLMEELDARFAGRRDALLELYASTGMDPNSIGVKAIFSEDVWADSAVSSELPGRSYAMVGKEAPRTTLQKALRAYGA